MICNRTHPLDSFCKQTIRVTNNPGNNTYTGISQYREYLMRPQHPYFENLCWYAFVLLCEFIQFRKGETLVKNEQFRLHRNSDSYNSKVVVMRKKPVVVQIWGGTIRPEQRRDTDAKEEEFSMQMMLLFVPHRQNANLRLPQETWTEALGRLRDPANAIFSKDGENFVKHHQDRWDTTFRSEEEAKNRREALKLKLEKKMRISSRIHKHTRIQTQTERIYTWKRMRTASQYPTQTTNSISMTTTPPLTKTHIL
jgi:hypothetical protein